VANLFASLKTLPARVAFFLFGKVIKLRGGELREPEGFRVRARKSKGVLPLMFSRFRFLSFVFFFFYSFQRRARRLL
jgi:hypothetical protein